MRRRTLINARRVCSTQGVGAIMAVSAMRLDGVEAGGDCQPVSSELKAEADHETTLLSVISCASLRPPCALLAPSAPRLVASGLRCLVY